MNKFIYFFFLVLSTVFAAIVFNHSMSEPFTVVVKVDLIWQLVLPSAFLMLSIMAVFLSFFDGPKKISIVFFFATLIFLIDIAIFFEAIYGYLWDLEYHIDVK